MFFDQLEFSSKTLTNEILWNSHKLMEHKNIKPKHASSTFMDNSYETTNNYEHNLLMNINYYPTNPKI